MVFSKDMVAASATPMILSILQKQDTYGYEIIKTVRELSCNRISWTDGMLYPVLHRLEGADLVQSYWMESEQGRRRKYYRITEAGRDECRQLIEQWAVVEQVLGKLAQEG